MTKTAKILAFVAAGSLAVLALVAILFTLLVGSCLHAAGQGIEEGERRAKQDAEDMQRSFQELDRKLNNIRPLTK